MTYDADSSMRARLLWWCALAVVVALAGYLYIPALHGPYIADDYPNLVYNQALRPAVLTLGSLIDAAFSFRSGIFYRPITMASFTLTYHLAGSDGAYAIKAVNLALHLLTGLALLFLARRLLPRLAGVDDTPAANRLFDWLALFVAAGWLLHPLQVSTVLYSVQRMTGLSALFMAWACYVYVAGRERMLRECRGYAATFIAVSLLGMLALFSKENGGLLPLLLLCIELACFRFAWRDDAPRWMRLALPTSLLLPVAILCVYLASLYIGHANEAIPGRQFTLNERLLTEARVLWIYLGWLLLLPIRPMSFYHDDLLISRSLTDPGTTLIACLAWLAVAVLIWFALRRPKLRYLAFGLGWFLVLQLLESTVIPLEPMWEHRVYLSAFGPLLAFSVLLGRMALHYPQRGRIIAAVSGALLLGLVCLDTAARIEPWRDRGSLSESFVLLNPGSPRAWSGLATDLLQQGQYPMARLALENAAGAAPQEAGYPIGLAVTDCLEQHTPSAELRERILDRLAHGPVTAFTNNQFDQYIKQCVMPAQRYDITTLPIITAAAQSADRQLEARAEYQAGSAALQQHLPEEAARHWEKVRRLDRSAVVPRLELAVLYLDLQRPTAARAVLDELAGSALPTEQAARLRDLRERLEKHGNSPAETDPHQGASD